MSTSNGLLAALIQYAVKDMHVSPDDAIWKVPTGQILLCMRQDLFKKDPNQMNLQDIEAIESGLI